MTPRRDFPSGGGRTDVWRRETGRSVFLFPAIFWVCLNSDLKKKHQRASLVSLFLVPPQAQAQSYRRRAALREIQTTRNAAQPLSMQGNTASCSSNLAYCEDTSLGIAVVIVIMEDALSGCLWAVYRELAGSFEGEIKEEIKSIKSINCD